MKTLMQHKSFIYHGESHKQNLNVIKKDLSVLLGVSEEDVFYQEDVFFYDCEQLRVDDWETLRSNFLFGPAKSYKVIVLGSAEKLSLVLLNKLLKPVEEADQKVKVIFSTTKPLIDTIKSRSITIKIVEGNQSRIPKSEKELMDFFSVSEANITMARMPLIGLYKAIKENGSLIKATGLIKEKSKALSFFADKVPEIAKLIILYEIETGRISERSKVASQYLEIEPSEGELYLMMLELEAKRGVI